MLLYLTNKLAYATSEYFISMFISTHFMSFRRVYHLNDCITQEKQREKVIKHKTCCFKRNYKEKESKLANTACQIEKAITIPIKAFTAFKFYFGRGMLQLSDLLNVSAPYSGIHLELPIWIEFEAFLNVGLFVKCHFNYHQRHWVE